MDSQNSILLRQLESNVKFFCSNASVKEQKHQGTLTSRLQIEVILDSFAKNERSYQCLPLACALKLIKYKLKEEEVYRRKILISIYRCTHGAIFDPLLQYAAMMDSNWKYDLQRWRLHPFLQRSLSLVRDKYVTLFRMHDLLNSHNAHWSRETMISVETAPAWNFLKLKIGEKVHILQELRNVLQECPHLAILHSVVVYWSILATVGTTTDADSVDSGGFVGNYLLSLLHSSILMHREKEKILLAVIISFVALNVVSFPIWLRGYGGLLCLLKHLDQVIYQLKYSSPKIRYLVLGLRKQMAHAITEKFGILNR